MKRSVFLFSTPAAAAALLLSGCSKTNPQTEPTLSVSPAERTIVFTAAATESYTFTVETNQQQWSAGSDQDWCVVTEDQANKTFTVTALANESETTAPPDAAITVSAGDASPVVITATMGAAQYSVYLAGYYRNINRDNVCCYWKDGERFDLEAPPDIDYYGVRSIIVSGGNVYVGGYYYDDDDDLNTICYWKDGVRVDMEDPFGQGMGDNSYLAIADGSLYVAGDYWNENRDTSIACYWKDGARFDCEFTDLSNNYPRSIAIYESDVYMAGVSNNSNCYWKNGVLNYFEDPQGIYTTTSIAVHEGLLYITGIDNVGSGTYVACYWKGGERVILSEEYSWTSAITVTDEGSVYVSGGYRTASGTGQETTYCYWKDGIRTDITKENYGSFQYYITGSMTVVQGSVYVCGAYYDEQEDAASPCYWKDGVRVDLEVPAGSTDLAAEYITVVL